MAHVKEIRIEVPLQTPEAHPNPTFEIERKVLAIDSTKKSPLNNPHGSKTYEKNIVRRIQSKNFLYEISRKDAGKNLWGQWDQITICTSRLQVFT